MSILESITNWLFGKFEPKPPKKEFYGVDLYKYTPIGRHRIRFLDSEGKEASFAYVYYFYDQKTMERKATLVANRDAELFKKYHTYMLSVDAWEKMNDPPSTGNLFPIPYGKMDWVSPEFSDLVEAKFQIYWDRSEHAWMPRSGSNDSQKYKEALKKQKEDANAEKPNLVVSGVEGNVLKLSDINKKKEK